MGAVTDAFDFYSIADEVIAALDDHRQIATFSSRTKGLTLVQAYRVTPLLRAAFEARGERIVGRKIGFTNRDMWDVYGVRSPVWGYVTDHTVQELASIRVMAVNNFSEPRIEPEIIFGLKTAPSLEMSETELLDCIEWASLGFEIVQSIYPGWKFMGADTVVANGVHGALLLGRRHAIAPRRPHWRNGLTTFSIELYCDGELSQSGGGALVLGSPLRALRHLVQLLADDPNNPPLQEGEIISTGTLTLAMPVVAGQRWTTEVSGIPLGDISLDFE
jgi:2-keto-4-pentenoate hydratase